MQVPIKYEEKLQLQSLGMASDIYKPATVSLESEKYICVKEVSPDGSTFYHIVDISAVPKDQKKPIQADAIMMHPTMSYLCLRTGQQIQIADMTRKDMVKEVVIPEQILFWKWINVNILGVVGTATIFHIDLTQPGKDKISFTFPKTPEMNESQILSYQANSSGKWLVLAGIQPGEKGTVKGNIQLFSPDNGSCQMIEGFAPCFADVALIDPKLKNSVIALVSKKASEDKSTFYIRELGASAIPEQMVKKMQPFQYPPEVANDFPVFAHISDRYGISFIITKMGYLFMFELYFGNMILRKKLTNDVIFAICKFTESNGFLGINTKGSVLHIAVEESNILGFLRTQCSHIPENVQIAFNISQRIPTLPGAEQVAEEHFNRVLATGDIMKAAKIAMLSPNQCLRTLGTIQKFKALPPVPGQPHPLLQYMGTNARPVLICRLLEGGKLNEVESIELTKPVVMQNKKNLIEDWLNHNKLECTPELGELIKTIDQQLALVVFKKCNSTDRVVQGLVETGQMDQISKYTEKAGYQPDYLAIIKRMLESGNTDKAQSMAAMACDRKNGTAAPLVPIQAVFDLFLQYADLDTVAAVMLGVLACNKPEDEPLQTKLLEISIAKKPKIAEVLIQGKQLTHYNRLRIAQACEVAGLFYEALINYNDINDIKRVIVNTHILNKDQVIDFLGTLEAPKVLACLYDLMKANKNNLQIVIEASTKYDHAIPVAELIKMYESFNSVDGLYYYLGQILSRSEDPEVYFKYIEAATKLNNLREVERVVRETTFYDPKRVKDFLMEFRLPDPKALIYLCDKHGFVEELTNYLYKNGFFAHIEIYLYKVNPNATPQVMCTLLDLECDETSLKKLLRNIRMCPIDQLVKEFEKRNKLKMLVGWLEARSTEGNQTPELHTALAKIYIDTNKDPQNFLINNQYYDSKEVGKFCEEKDPHLAYLAYKKSWGKCDQELIALTNKNLLFRLQARYLVERMDPVLWKTVLDPGNQYRKNVVEQVVSTALPETENADEVAATVRAFIAADIPSELMSLLENIVLHRSEFADNAELQDVLLLTAMKANPSQVLDFVNRLNNFNGVKLAQKALEYNLFEEACAIYVKFDMPEEAIDVMLSKVKDLVRAEIYASKINLVPVWSKLGSAQLAAGKVSEAISSLLKAEDTTSYLMVIGSAERDQKYEDLVEYLLMARKKMKNPAIDEELIYAYGQCKRYDEVEDFIRQAHSADLQRVGDRAFEDKLYETGKILFAYIGNNARLASCLVHLGQFQAALEAAKKADTPRTWKEVNYACVRAREFKLAAIAGLKIIIHPDHVEDLIMHYEKYGYWEELIKLMDAGTQLENANNTIFTELGCLLAKYVPTRLMDHIKNNFQRLHIPKLLGSCREYQMWPEAVFLHSHYDEYDNAVIIMIDHSPSAWQHDLFVQNIQKVSNTDLHYKAMYFYLKEQPMLLNDLLIALAEKLDLQQTVIKLKKTGYIALCLPFLKTVQMHDIATINEAVNEIFLENDDHNGLRSSVTEHDKFDKLALAKKLEAHPLMEFRRISALLYRIMKKFPESINLSKKDGLFKDATETALDSKQPELAEHLLRYFVAIKDRECFAACLYTCYELLKPDIAMELAWRFGLMEFVMPFMIQAFRDMSDKLENVNKKTDDIQRKEEKEAAKQEQFMGAGIDNMMMMPEFSPYLAIMPSPESMMGMNAAGMVGVNYLQPNFYPMLPPAKK